MGKTIGVQLNDAKKAAKKGVSIGQSVKQTVAQTASTIRTLDKILTKPDNNNGVHPAATGNNKTAAAAGKQVSSRGGVKTTAAATVTRKDEEKTEIAVPASKVGNNRRSLDSEKSDESSLYVSALDTLPEENAKRLSRTSNKIVSVPLSGTRVRCCMD